MRGMRDFDPSKLKPGYAVASDNLGSNKPGVQSLSKAEETLALAFRVLDEVPEPEREYRFHPKRRWRFDFAWPDYMVAVEVEGITQQGGRHQRIDGFKKDLEKYEAALLGGWIVYRCDYEMIKKGRAVQTILKLLDRNTQ